MSGFSFRGPNNVSANIATNNVGNGFYFWVSDNTNVSANIAIKYSNGFYIRADSNNINFTGNTATKNKDFDLNEIYSCGNTLNIFIADKFSVVNQSSY